MASTWYWVGGTGTWNTSSTTNWASSSGGTGGAGVPATTDSVIFDSNSGGGTVTTSGVSTVNTVSLAGVTLSLGTALTITNSFSLNANGTFQTNNYAWTLGEFSCATGGSCTLSLGSSAVNVTYTSGTVWNVTSTTMTVTSNTATITFATTGSVSCAFGSMTYTGTNVTVNSSGGGMTLTSAMTVTGTVTLTQGTLNTNGQTCTWGSFSSNNSNTRTLTMGASAITISGSASTVWVIASGTMTITTNTATITFTGTGSVVMTASSMNYNGTTIVINCSSNFTLGGAATFANLTYAPTAGTTSALTPSSGITITVTGNLTFTGTNAPNTPIVASNTLGTQMTFACNGTVTLSGRMDFRDIKGAGTATWNFSTSGGDCQGNSGIIFATAQTNYYKASAAANFSTAGNWYLATNGGGGAGRVPFPQDTVVFDGNSGNYSYTFDTTRFGSLTTTGWTGSMNASSNMNWQCYGNLTSGTSLSLTGTYSSIYLFGRGSQTITSPTSNASVVLYIESFGGTYTLQNALYMNQVGLSCGTFTTNNYNVYAATVGIYPSAASPVTVNMGSGTWQLNNSVAGQTAWLVNSTSGLTFNCNTSTITIVLYNSTAGTWTFAGGGLTYYNVTWINANTANQVLAITGANTFNSFTTTVTSTGTKTITWPASVTNTFTNLTWTGIPSNIITINSNISGTYGTMDVTGTLNVSYVSLKDNRGIGTPTFWATGDSSIVSNAVNWQLTSFFGSSSSSSQDSATLGGNGLLTGSLSSTSYALATASATGTLTGTSASTSLATSYLSGSGALIGSLASNSYASSTISGSGSLNGSSTSTSTANGAMTGDGYLVGSSLSFTYLGGVLAVIVVSDTAGTVILTDYPSYVVGLDDEATFATPVLSDYPAYAVGIIDTQGPTSVPSDYIDLRNWYWSGCTAPPPGSDTNAYCTIYNDQVPALDDGGYLSPWFTVVDGQVQFQANSGGVTTPGSLGPRSELREMYNDGSESAAFSFLSGTHFAQVTGSCTALPPVEARAVVLQLHGEDSFGAICEILVDATDGPPRVAYKFTNGSDPVESTNHIIPDYTLGDSYTLGINVPGDGTVELYNGSTLFTTLTIPDGVPATGCYFKAGCYLQVTDPDSDPPSAVGTAYIASGGLIVSHDPFTSVDASDPSNVLNSGAGTGYDSTTGTSTPPTSIATVVLSDSDISTVGVSDS